MWNVFSCAYFSFAYLLWKTVYSNPLPVFKLGYFFFFFNWGWGWGTTLRSLLVLSSTTRDWTRAAAVPSFDHWTTREFPQNSWLACISLVVEFPGLVGKMSQVPLLEFLLLGWWCWLWRAHFICGCSEHCIPHSHHWFRGPLSSPNGFFFFSHKATLGRYSFQSKIHVAKGPPLEA